MILTCHLYVCTQICIFVHVSLLKFYQVHFIWMLFKMKLPVTTYDELALFLEVFLVLESNFNQLHFKTFSTKSQIVSAERERRAWMTAEKWWLAS